jgi:hypothetical protein
LRKVSNTQKGIDTLQSTFLITRNNKMNRYIPIIGWVENGLTGVLIKSKNSYRLPTYSHIEVNIIFKMKIGRYKCKTAGKEYYS